MTGDREQGFDPNGGGEVARPLRPLNATQWAGLGLLVLGAVGIAIFVLGRVGAIPKFLDDPIPLLVLAPLGSALLNARHPTALCDADTLKRRRIAAVSLAIVAAVGAILAFLLARGG